MSRLVETEQLRLRLGLRDHAEVLARLDSYNLQATVRLAQLLRTGFAQHTYSDVFRTDERLMLARKPTLNLRLTHGFVDSGSEVTIKVGPAYNDLASAPTTPATAYWVDWDRGIIVMHEGWYPRGHAEITYTAGFVSKGGVYQDVPDWLQQAAILWVEALYPRYSDSKDKKDEAIIDNGQAPATVASLVCPMIREYPSTVGALDVRIQS